jgi:hypothetical protein
MQHEIVEQYLSEPVAPGVSLRTWIADNVRADETIVANRGQATGYVLGRNVVSLVSLEYSRKAWDEPRMRSVMQTYGARYLILYAGGDVLANRVLTESAFLSGLLERSAPAWLRLRVRSPDVFVFEAEVRSSPSGRT